MMADDATRKLFPTFGELSRIGREARMQGGAIAFDHLFRGLSRMGRLYPGLLPKRHGVEVISDVPYRATGLSAHTLDVYRPIDRSGPLPSVLYVHGGSFRFLSKETHWIMGLCFARLGYVVFNINYRLAPGDPYPAAVEDTCRAFLWLGENARKWGADPERIILTGESAGANLATALAVAGSWRREEPFAREIFDNPLRPRGVIAACGFLQVTDPERFVRRRRLPTVVYDRLAEVQGAYLRGGEGASELADPLCVIEAGDPDRPLPPIFAFAGTKDPLLDDTRRLVAALGRIQSPCEVRYYPGEVHAFHAFLWRANAVACWRETEAFCERCLHSGDSDLLSA